MKKKLWTVKEVSEYLNVKRSTLYSWVRNGIIPTRKLGISLRFDPTEVMEIVEASRVIPANVLTLRTKSTKNLDIDAIVNKAIEGTNGSRYTPSKRKTRPRSGSQGRRS